MEIDFCIFSHIKGGRTTSTETRVGSFSLWSWRSFLKSEKMTLMSSTDGNLNRKVSPPFQPRQKYLPALFQANANANLQVHTCIWGC